MIALFLIILTSFFTTGLIVRTKSIAAGRKGPGILQPVRNVWVLLRKGLVYSETSGIISRLAPVPRYIEVPGHQKESKLSDLQGDEFPDHAIWPILIVTAGNVR